MNSLGVESGKEYIELTRPGSGSVSILDESAGDIRSFWNVDDGYWASTQAILVNVTDNAYVYIQTVDPCGHDVFYDGVTYFGYVTQEDVNLLVSEFDLDGSINDIYGRDRQAFGNERPTGADGDSHVTILLLDIDGDFCDGFCGGGYVAGYYHSLNEGTSTHSNQRKMVYVDTFPGVENGRPEPSSVSCGGCWSSSNQQCWEPTLNHTDSYFEEGMRTSIYGTVAHEFQHLIHWYYDSTEDDWVNEGLSDYSYQVNGYGDPYYHLLYFENNPDTNLILWSGSLQDYGASYLFFLYLAEQYGGNNTIKQIVDDSLDGIDGVNSALSAQGYSETFEDVFKDWVVANILDDTSISDGRYGYEASNPSPDFEAEKSSYQATGSGSVNSWAADYIAFRSGNGSNLNVSFNGLDSKLFSARIVRTDSINPPAVRDVNLDAAQDGSKTTNSFGSAYDEIILVAAGLSSGGSYSYQADYTLGFDEDETAPEVTLYYPEDNLEQILGNVVFTYNVSDDSPLLGCNLWGNFTGSWDSYTSNSSPVQNLRLNNFSVGDLVNGRYSWNIVCQDNFSNNGTSSANRTLVYVGDCVNDTIVINQNISLNGESFSLSNCALLFNSTRDLELGLSVDPSSNLTISDSSTVSSVNASLFFMTSQGNITVTNSTIQGADTLKITNGSYTISDSTFIDAAEYAITFPSYWGETNFTQLAQSNTFINNTLGQIVGIWEATIYVRDFQGFNVSSANVNVTNSLGTVQSKTTSQPGSAQFSVYEQEVNNSGYLLNHTPHNISVAHYIFRNSTSSQINSTKDFNLTLELVALINEFEPNAANGSDWIELFNTRQTDQNLTDWILGHENPQENYSIGLGNVVGQESYIVFNDTILGFSINDSNDTIYLFDSSDRLIDSISYFSGQTFAQDTTYNESQPASIGRVTDGSADWMVFDSPSPSTENLGEILQETSFFSGWTLVAFSLLP
ncbi:MAG: lamin tail domain-containing protein [Candidatus Altiarchaeota archaeon]